MYSYSHHEALEKTAGYVSFLIRRHAVSSGRADEGETMTIQYQWVDDARTLVHLELPKRTFGEKYASVDPSHANDYRRLLFGPKTGIDPVRVDATESKPVFLCVCKGTGNRPFCDGTHKKG